MPGNFQRIGFLGPVGMQLDRGQRGAQLVRGIGNELALRVERVAQPRQQCIEAADQRRHLGRHLGLVQRGE
ncbi:hypothetical protein D3C87_2011100 [compost metagenome]